MLISARTPPAGWSLSLVTEPSKPSIVHVHRDTRHATSGAVNVLHHVLLGEARGLVARLRSAVAAVRDIVSGDRQALPSQVYASTATPWSVYAYHRVGASHISLDAWLGDYPGDRISVRYQISVRDASTLADSLDELLAQLDPPPSEFPAGVDPDPERGIPEMFRLQQVAA